MYVRDMLIAMTLSLFPAVPLAAQETGGETEAADRTEAVPHPHDGFDFPSREIRAAAEAGLAWLELVDAKEFEESWVTGSSALQTSASPQVLKSMISDGREPFRPLGVRTLVSAQELSNPPNAPPGEYVMLRYRTEASGDRTITETVVPRWEGDAWRVAGYFIQRE